MVANMLLVVVPCVSAKPEHVVIDKASASERLGKILFLLWRGVKPETICALNIHLHRLTHLFKGHKLKPSLISPALKGGVLRDIR